MGSAAQADLVYNNGKTYILPQGCFYTMPSPTILRCDGHYRSDGINLRVKLSDPCPNEVIDANCRINLKKQYNFEFLEAATNNGDNEISGFFNTSFLGNSLGMTLDGTNGSSQGATSRSRVLSLGSSSTGDEETSATQGPSYPSPSFLKLGSDNKIKAENLPGSANLGLADPQEKFSGNPNLGINPATMDAIARILNGPASNVGEIARKTSYVKSIGNNFSTTGTPSEVGTLESEKNRDSNAFENPGFTPKAPLIIKCHPASNTLGVDTCPRTQS
jgi:hypothetical protein